jgi:hypothetical protein
MIAPIHPIRILLISAGLACGATTAMAQADRNPATPRPAATGSITDEAPTIRPDTGAHKLFDALLHEFVHDGVVDYTGLSRQRPRLKSYLETLAVVDPGSLDRNALIAFWVNAYNAFTIELILENLGRIDSIKDISSSKRWDAKRWLVSGRKYSLDEIEHKIMRPMGEPRIHFALVCASFSCPDLRPEAYLPQTLDKQLTDAARHFLANNKKGLRTRMEKGFFGGDDPTLYLSSIFDWFEGDFEKNGGDVLSFVRQYAPKKAVAFIDQHRDDLDIDNFDYDWSLNGR